jgi:phosphatidylinositol glycan class B
MTALLYYTDSAFYGRPVFTPLNFTRTNLSSISLVYGRNAWHYYFTQAIPILCASSLPFVVKGLYLGLRTPSDSLYSKDPKSSKSRSESLKILAGTALWTITVYSLSGHKEWRFIHPVLPILHIFAAKGLVGPSESNTMEKQPSAQGDSSGFLWTASKSHLALLLLQLPVILYCIAYRSSPQVSVMSYLRSLSRNGGEVRSVGFLMPCHSTPWQSHLHNPQLSHPGMLWAIGCEPPLQGQDVGQYRDQTDVFYESPLEYLKTRFPADVDLTFPPSSYPCSPPNLPEKPATDDEERHVEESDKWKHEWPEYLVMFGHLLDSPGVRKYLTRTMRYKIVWRAGYGFDEEPNRSGGVFVLKAPHHHRPPSATPNRDPNVHEKSPWDGIHNHKRLVGHSQ